MRKFEKGFGDPEVSNKDTEEQNILDAKKIAKNTGIVGVAEIPLRVIQFINGIIITRVVGSSIFGIYTLGATVLGFANIAGTLGLYQGAMRYVGMNKDDQKRATGVVVSSLGVAFTASVIFGVLLFAGSTYLARSVFGVPDLAWVLRGLAIALPADVLVHVAISCIRGFQNIRIYTLIEKILKPTGSLVFTIIFFALGYRLHGLVYRHITVGWLLALVSMILLRHIFPAAFHWREASYNDTCSLIKFSIPLVFAEFLYTLMIRADVVMIGAFLGPSDVGIYSVALLLVGSLLIPLAAIDTIIYPMLAECMGKQDTDRVERIYQISVHWSLMMVLPIAVIGTVYSEFLLGLFGKDFMAASHCFGIIAGGYVGLASVGSTSAVLSMGGRTKLIFYNTLGVFVMNITLNYVLVHIWGITGVAMATGLTTLLWGLLMLIEVKAIFNIRFPKSEVLKSLVVGGFILLIAGAFRMSGFIQLPVMNFAIGSIGILFLFMFGFKYMKLLIPEDTTIFNVIIARFRM